MASSIDLTQILTEHKSPIDSIEARAWDLGYEDKTCRGYILPSLDTNPDTRKIRLLFRAQIDRQQGMEIGQHLMQIAEEMQEFDQPAPTHKIKLTGRNWEVSRLGDRALKHWKYSLRPRRIFIEPLHRVEDGRRWAVKFVADADITPKQARDIGAYLEAISMQIDGE